jgi:ABC-type transport system substrate-binding protein
MSTRKEIVVRTRHLSALVALLALVIGPLLLIATAQGTPEGEMVLAWHVTIAPAWFDPIDTPAQITPYGALHAFHDALVRPLPGEKMGNSLAESWTESPEQVPGFGAFQRCKGGACKSPLSVL